MKETWESRGPGKGKAVDDVFIHRVISTMDFKPDFGRLFKSRGRGFARELRKVGGMEEVVIDSLT